jgi:ABC-type nitrate/sulfonate/bicarbonate transport system permease component
VSGTDRTTDTAVRVAAAVEDVRPAAGIRRLPKGEAWIGAASLAVGAIAWEVIGRVADVPFFPPLSEVLVRMVELLTTGEIIGYLLTSLTNLAIGFGVSLVIGLGVGLLMGVYRRVDLALDIYVRAMLTAPSLVFAPIFFSLFGLNRITIIGIIVLYSTFIMILTTASAVKAAPKSLVEMARCYGANDRYVFRRVLVPSAMPLIMAGVRLGAGRAVKGMINGEMFIAVVGLGGVVMTAGRNFDATTVLAVMVIIILVAFGLVWIVERLDRHLTSWLPETARG